MSIPAPPNDPLASVKEEQWIEVWVKLRFHTRKRYSWLSRRLGVDLDDIAHQAIVDTMSRKRRWPPIDALTGEMKTEVNLFSFLCEVVRSNISHVWERERRTVSIDTDSTNDPKEFNQEFIDYLLNESANTYHHSVKPDDIESNVTYNDITDKMLNIVASDTEVYRIVELWREEPDLKPKELAARLGIPIYRVRAAQKRLRRLLRKFREASSNG